MKRYVLCFVPALMLIAGPSVDAAEGDGIRLTALSSMERIGQDQELYGGQQAEIQAARNEWESFQVVVAAGDENVLVTKAEMSDLAGSAGARIGKDCIKLYREEYVRVRRPTRRAELPPGLYPDALVPFVNPITDEAIGPPRRVQERWGGPTTVEGHEMHALPFEIFRGQNQPIWVDVQIPKDAPAGVYEGMFRVRAQRGLSAEIPVKLTVWDFTLPDGPTHRNHFGHFRNVARYFDIPRDSDKFKEIEMRYCRAMAEHRLNPPLPHHLLPEVNNDGSLTVVPEHHEALKKFTSELHVTDFEIPRAPFARLRVSATDADYFVLLEQVAGREAVKKLVDEIAPNWWDYCKQPDKLLEVRQEFAKQPAVQFRPGSHPRLCRLHQRNRSVRPSRHRTQRG